MSEERSKEGFSRRRTLGTLGGLAGTTLLPVTSAFGQAAKGKPITETSQLTEFLEYLDLFGQAKGVIPLPVTSDDAVRLLTAHAAKGLEFRHVAILRRR